MTSISQTTHQVMITCHWKTILNCNNLTSQWQFRGFLISGQRDCGKSGPHCWGREGSTQFAQSFVIAVTAPLLVGYRLEPKAVSFGA